MFKTPRRKQIDSALNSVRDRKHSFLRFDDMHNILILFHYEDWNEIKPIVEDLDKNGKHTILWTVKPKKKSRENVALTDISASSSNIRIIDGRDVSWYSGLSEVVDSEFKLLQYDTLMDLTTSSDRNLFYLLASNTAQFCIGIKEANHRIYDFIVLKEDSKSLPDTYNQIKFYLNNIHKDK